MLEGGSMSRDDTWQEWENVGDNRPPVYDDHIQPSSGPHKDDFITVRVFRASGLGGCDRSLTAWGQGVDGTQTIPDVIRRAWAEGHRNEPIILNLLYTRELKAKDREGNETVEVWRALDEYDIEMQGYGVMEDVGEAITDTESTGPIHARQAKVILPFHNLTHPTEIRASLDGVATIKASLVDRGLPKGTTAVTEAKAFAASTYDKWARHGLAAFPGYEIQVSIQGHGTGLPVLFVVGIKDDEGVVQDIVTDYFPVPPLSLGKLRARVAKLNRLIDAGSLDFACPKPLMYPCPHLFLHDDDERAVQVGVAAEDIPDVGVLQLIAKGFAEAKKVETEAAKNRKKGEAIIKQWLLDHPEMEGQEILVPVGDGEFVRMKCDVGGLREVKHDAEPGRTIEAKPAWDETIHHEAEPEQVIPARDAWTKTTGTRRVTITAEVTKEGPKD